MKIRCSYKKNVYWISPFLDNINPFYTRYGVACTKSSNAVASSCCTGCEQGLLSKVNSQGCQGNNAGGYVGQGFKACCGKG